MLFAGRKKKKGAGEQHKKYFFAESGQQPTETGILSSTVARGDSECPSVEMDISDSSADSFTGHLGQLSVC